MNDGILMNIYYCILIMLPPMLSAPLSVYFITEVLRYRIRNKRFAYVLAFVLGAFAGIVFALTGSDLTESGSVLSGIALLFSSFVLLIYLGFSMVERKWVRFLVVFFSMDILTDLGTIFSGLRDQIYTADAWSDDIRIMFTSTMISLPGILFEFLLFSLIARMRRKKDDMPLPLSIIIGLCLVLNIFTMFLPGEYDDTDLLPVEKPIRIVFMLSALAFVTMLFYVRVARKERDDLREMNRINEELIESETRFFEASAEANDRIRAMKHDMKNDTQVLLLLLENREYDKMKDYLEEMGQNIVNADISAHTGNTIADAIIAEKKEKADKAGIRVNVSGVITDVEFSPVDTCKILANILDNAIEAVSDERFCDLDPSYKVIDLKFKRTEKFFMISQTNPCVEKPEIRNGLIETIKADVINHGFGLSSIKDAAAVYGGELSLECNPKPYGYEFITELIFPVIKESE
ncbi:MAG: GHKL domain-containing protein [Lachnospiraceae bacterium]|nr:GHKL domain-containing protein [Lachnospiraceae bacterium]